MRRFVDAAHFSAMAAVSAGPCSEPWTSRVVCLQLRMSARPLETGEYSPDNLPHG